MVALSVSEHDTSVRVDARPALGERLAAAFCLAQCSEPFFNAVAQAEGLTEAPGYARLAYAPVVLFLGWMSFGAPRLLGRAIAAAPLIIALASLAFLSALWSVDPGATLRRAIWLTLSIGTGLALAARYRWRDLLEVVALAFALMAAGSVALALAYPAAGIMTQEHPGAWSGLWTHKNMLGGVMALGVASGVAASAASRRRRWLLASAAAFALVILSTSKTALVATALGLGVIAFGFCLRRGPLFAIVAVAGAATLAILGGAVFLLAPDLVVGALGRDLSFTGRTDIWTATEAAVSARPWLGYGYGAFWVDPNGPATAVQQAVGWPAPSAHNGWLDLMLSLGGLGAALFATHLLLTAKRAGAALGDAVAGLWVPAFCAVFALYTLSESHVLESGDVFWTLYVAMSARLALDRREARL